MGKIKTFIRNKLIGGWSLAVRDDWSFKIKRVNITEEEKDLYEKEFGEEILTYSDFFDWWLKIHHYDQQKVDEKMKEMYDKFLNSHEGKQNK